MSPTIGRKSPKSPVVLEDNNQEEILILKKELNKKQESLQEAQAINTKLSCRIKVLEGRSAFHDGNERLNKHLETVAILTTKVEHAEGETKNAESRFQDVLSQLEKQTILSKDRDQKIQSLEEEVYLSHCWLSWYRLSVLCWLSWYRLTVLCLDWFETGPN